MIMVWLIVLSLGFIITYGPNPATLRIKPGDIVVAPTVDAGGYDENGDQISEYMRQNSPDTVFSGSNPLTGPVYVEGTLRARNLQRMY